MAASYLQNINSLNENIFTLLKLINFILFFSLSDVRYKCKVLFNSNFCPALTRKTENSYLHKMYYVTYSMYLLKVRQCTSQKMSIAVLRQETATSIITSSRHG